MRSIILSLSFVACGSPELEQKNADLAAKLETSQEKEASLKKEVDRLKTKLQKMERSLSDMKKSETLRELGMKKEGQLGAIFHTSMGAISCDLLPEIAPETVLNFVHLAEGTKEWLNPKTKEKTSSPLYNGTIFHRVIPKFMIQGGDPLGSGRGGPGYRFEDETTPEVTFDKPGLLAMANSGPNTNGSQFFITDRSTPAHLSGKHTIFGRCENLDVVEAIASVDRGARDKPKVDVVLKRVEITR
jgi:peptidyl-prolyl cis-trans isomerase A (cyclophilin A)